MKTFNRTYVTYTRILLAMQVHVAKPEINSVGNRPYPQGNVARARKKMIINEEHK